MDKKLDDFYKKYKSKDLESIRGYLKRIKIVKLVDGRYYEIGNDLLNRIIEKPRNISPSFSDEKLKELSLDLDFYDRIDFLVKSSSRFFLKPDIGEVFDQLDEGVINNISAICIDDDSETLINRDGDHFIMTATLLKNIKKIRKEKLNKIDKNGIESWR